MFTPLPTDEDRAAAAALLDDLLTAGHSRDGANEAMARALVAARDQGRAVGHQEGVRGLVDWFTGRGANITEAVVPDGVRRRLRRYADVVDAATADALRAAQ